MKPITRKLIIIAGLLFLLQLLVQPALADAEITVEYFYKGTCGSCITKKGYIENVEVFYNVSEDIIVFQMKNININSSYNDEYQYYQTNYGASWPFVVVKNSTNLTIVPNSHLTETGVWTYLNATIADYIAGIEPEQLFDENLVIIDTIFGRIEINVSALSLPVLTVVLGGLDSFNPCAFFILIILLNLLLYAQSRRRMLLIGGIFIFFSGLLYFVFMFVLFNVFLLTQEHISIVTIVAGIVALTLGIFNIKDFFFFKKGASLSIPDEKKPELFKRMRALVKAPQVAAAVAGTIVLAGVVNFYELLCTLGLPLVFTRQLALYDLSAVEQALYIFFYNVVYVIPLIVIVLIFVLTLGRIKLSDWHGQILKLLTGTMLTSFGILFLLDYTILENVVTPILLLVLSLVATAVIAIVWKRVQAEKEVE